MIDVIKKEIPLYELMGVFTEAPVSKKKKRIINMNARSNLLDFTDGMEPDEVIDPESFQFDDIDPEDMEDFADGSNVDELEDDSIESDDTGEEEFDDMDFTDGIDPTSDDEEDGDITVSDEENQEQAEEPVDNQNPPEDSGVENPDADTANPDETQPDDPNSPQEQQEGEPPVDSSNEEQTSGTELDLGDEEDFSSGSDVEDSGVENPDADTANPDETQPTDPNAKPSATKDDMRKFILYKKYMSLLQSIENYIDKIDNMTIDNKEADIIRRDVCNEFRNIQEILRDYMILKYEHDSYVQCALMYEKMRTAILLLFEKVKVIINNKKQ